MKNVFVIFVVVLVATAAAKKGWKLRQRQQCKYDKSAWSDCDTKTNTVSRVLTLKSGKEGCQQTQNQTITCDRFERLQAWKIKKAENRRELQEKKHQRKERQQEMKENKQLVKEQLKRCRYEHSDWSECDQATNTATRNFTLSEGEQGCEQSHTITITCDKLNRIQAWKAKKRDRKQKRIDEKLQMKQERKERRKLEKEQRLKCKYDKEDWSECDNTTNTVTRVMTLRDGEEEECEPIINVTISCLKFERIQQWKARKMERKNEKKENKMFIRKQKNMWKENKKIVKEQRRLGCSFDVTFSECDPTTNMVTKSYIPTTDDDDSCENRSFEYSCDLHERLMEKKRKRQDKRVNRKINRKEFRQQRLLI
ncbi:golgin subfamily A member 6-like protein 26 [Mytilus edulis]|uniref:golgin subfamily A member 6-like protein 26 n=1 Tax=Mytilus edulis TaxID=6550 RepID=UPI0039EFE1FA